MQISDCSICKIIRQSVNLIFQLNFFLSDFYYRTMSETEETSKARLMSAWTHLSNQMRNFNTHYEGRTLLPNSTSPYLKCIQSITHLNIQFGSHYIEKLDPKQKQKLFYNLNIAICDLVKKYKDSVALMEKIKIQKENAQHNALTICHNCKHQINQIQIINAKDILEYENGALTKKIAKMAVEIEKQATIQSYTKEENLSFIKDVKEVLQKKSELLDICSSEIDKYSQILESHFQEMSLSKQFSIKEFNQREEVLSKRNLGEEIKFQLKHSLSENFHQKMPKWIQKMFLEFNRQLENLKKSKLIHIEIQTDAQDNKKYNELNKKNHELSEKLSELDRQNTELKQNLSYKEQQKRKLGQQLEDLSGHLTEKMQIAAKQLKESKHFSQKIKEELEKEKLKNKENIIRMKKYESNKNLDDLGNNQSSNIEAQKQSSQILIEEQHFKKDKSKKKIKNPVKFQQKDKCYLPAIKKMNNFSSSKKNLNNESLLTEEQNNCNENYQQNYQQIEEVELSGEEDLCLSSEINQNQIEQDNRNSFGQQLYQKQTKHKLKSQKKITTHKTIKEEFSKIHQDKANLTKKSQKQVNFGKQQKLNHESLNNKKQQNKSKKNININQNNSNKAPYNIQQNQMMSKNKNQMERYSHHEKNAEKLSSSKQMTARNQNNNSQEVIKFKKQIQSVNDNLLKKISTNKFKNQTTFQKNNFSNTNQKRYFFTENHENSDQIIQPSNTFEQPISQVVFQENSISNSIFQKIYPKSDVNAKDIQKIYQKISNIDPIFKNSIDESTFVNIFNKIRLEIVNQNIENDKSVEKVNIFSKAEQIQQQSDKSQIKLRNSKVIKQHQFSFSTEQNKINFQPKENKLSSHRNSNSNNKATIKHKNQQKYCVFKTDVNQQSNLIPGTNASILKQLLNSPIILNKSIQAYKSRNNKQKCCEINELKSMKSSAKFQKLDLKENQLVLPSLNYQSNGNQTFSPREEIFSEKDFYIFIDQSIAYQYEIALNKKGGNHSNKKISGKLTEIIHKLYTQFQNIRKNNTASYRQLCNFLKHPYMTIKNQFLHIDVVVCLTYGQLQKYMEEIFWLHRKCEKNMKCCEHMQYFIQKIGGMSSQNDK